MELLGSGQEVHWDLLEEVEGSGSDAGRQHLHFLVELCKSRGQDGIENAHHLRVGWEGQVLWSRPAALSYNSDNDKKIIRINDSWFLSYFCIMALVGLWIRTCPIFKKNNSNDLFDFEEYSRYKHHEQSRKYKKTFRPSIVFRDVDEWMRLNVKFK